MKVEILGTGCPNCKKTYEIVEKVIKENNIDASIRKEQDILEIVKYNVMSLPAVVIDGEVKIKGYVPSEKEIKELFHVQ
ncbi:MAG: thioredoxin family protein [Bacteroidales bacterium]|jgi:small redox-active disulfide protein 2|nr:thioredoxin family protein [Bacteroidales bacterium]